MPRDVSTTLQAAIDKPGSYSFISKATVYPSNLYFGSIMANNAIPSADATGVLDNPIKQDITHNTASGLVTFYQEGGSLKYAVQGNSTPVTTTYAANNKPGVFGSKIYIYDFSASAINDIPSTSQQ